MADRTFVLDGRTVDVYGKAEAGQPVVYLNSYEGGEGSIEEILQQTGSPAHVLVQISGLAWEDDMTPWPCPPLSRKSAIPFGGKADAYLEWMAERLIPSVEAGLPAPPFWRGIAGYSLGGLFAVWSVFRTGLFSRLASCSGSLWYPGFPAFCERTPFAGKPRCAYFSLGDREAFTKNPLMKQVAAGTECIASLFGERGVVQTFVSNPGNHFVHAEERTASGINWILSK